MSDTPTFLLVHGSWHGPWCWERLIPELERLGFKAATVALPSCGSDPAKLGGLTDDAAAVEAAAAALEGKVIVVGHSYGGVVLTEARFGANVSRLVYLGAFMPDAGQSIGSLLPPGPLPAYVDLRADGISAIVMDQVGPMLYGDCDAATVSVTKARLVLQNGAVVVTPVSHAGWRKRSSTYIVLTEDLAVPTPAQRMFALQAGQTVEFTSSHSPFASRPADLAGVLAGIAVAVVAA